MNRVPRDVEDVTAAWLGGHLGPVEVTRISRIGAAHGFASTVVRVRGRAATGPLDVVVKLTAAESARRESWFLRLAAAEQLVPALPRCLGAAVDDESGTGALVVEHVEGVQGDVTVPVPRRVPDALLGVLAGIHTRFAGAGDELLDAVRTVPRPRFLVRPDRLAAVLDRRAPDGPTREALAWLAAEAPAAHERLTAAPTTLVHGDVHMDNVLLTGDGPVLLDWEGVRLGCAAEDVAGLVTVRTTNGPEPDRLERTCGAYVDAVRRAGGSPPAGLRAQVRAALVARAAGTVNWVGRVAVTPSTGARQRAVVRAALDDVVAVVALVS